MQCDQWHGGAHWLAEVREVICHELLRLLPERALRDPWGLLEERLVFHYTDLKTAQVVLLREWFVACPSSLVHDIEALRPALPSTELILRQQKGLLVSQGGYAGVTGGRADTKS